MEGHQMTAYAVGLYNFHKSDWLEAYKDKVTELWIRKGGVAGGA